MLTQPVKLLHSMCRSAVETAAFILLHIIILANFNILNEL